ncbi:MAG: septum formation initiator family protein [Carboxydocellales bacterium]
MKLNSHHRTPPKQKSRYAAKDNKKFEQDKLINLRSPERAKEQAVRAEKRDKHSGIKSKKLWGKLLAVAVLAYGFVVITSFGEQFMQLREINRNIDQVQEKIRMMQGKNKELALEIKLLQSDTYVERIAREKLGLVKPGETVLLQAEVEKGKPLPKSNKGNPAE